MKNFLKLVATLILLIGGMCEAQNTALTATVVDSDSTTWASGSWSIVFVPNSNYPNISSYTINGAALSPSILHQSGSLNGSGQLSATIYNSGLIQPAGSGWAITVCPNASAPCGLYNFATASSSQDISSGLTSTIPAPRFHPVSGTYGYIDGEATMALVPGSTYFNVTSNTQRIWNGSAWFNSSGTAISLPVAIANGGTGQGSAAAALAALGGISASLTSPQTMASQLTLPVLIASTSLSSPVITASTSVTTAALTATSETFGPAAFTVAKNSYITANMLGNYSGSSGFQPEFEVLSDSCNAATEWNQQQGTGTNVAAVTGCVLAPNTSSAQQISGGAFFARSLAASTFVVGVYGQGVVGASGGTAWGGNFVASDQGSQTNSSILGLEIDLNATNTSTNVKGIDLIGAWSAQPSNAPAIDVESPVVAGSTTQGVYYWQDALQVGNGATGGTAIFIGPASYSYTAPTTSQAIIQEAFGTGGIINAVNANLNTSGAYVLTLSTNGSTTNTVTIPNSSSGVATFLSEISSPFFALSTGGGGLIYDTVTSKVGIVMNSAGFEILNSSQTNQRMYIDNTGNSNFNYGTMTVNNLTINGSCTGCPGGSSGLSGMTAGQVPIAATASTITSSKVLAGSGTGITTGPTSSTSNDIVTFTGTGGQIQDSSVSITGSGSYVPTLVSNSTTSGDFVSNTGTSGEQQDSGIPAFGKLIGARYDTGLSGNVATVTYISTPNSTVPSTGFYNVCGSFIVTTAGTTGPNLNLVWTSGDDTVVKNTQLGAGENSAADATYVSGGACTVLYLLSGSQVGYKTGGASSTTPVYSVRLRYYSSN